MIIETVEVTRIGRGWVVQRDDHQGLSSRKGAVGRMSNAYLQRKLAAEDFGERIKAATNHPSVLRVNVLDKARKIVVVPDGNEPFMIENNANTVEELAAHINDRLK